MTEKNSIFTYEIVGVRPDRFTHYCSPNGRIDGRNESYVLSHTMRSFGFYVMSDYSHLIGEKFNRLTITEILENKIPNTNRRCIAVCECGNIKEYRLSHVRYGATVSCGCILSEAKTKHGMSGHPLQQVFTNMKERCYNEKNDNYHRYGGRGIGIYAEWLNNREAFYKWALLNGYKKGLQLDRIDNNSNYSPNNCRFVSPKVNSNNRGNNVHVVKNGISKTVSEWCENNNINIVTVHNRLTRGWDIEEAILKPIQSTKKYMYNNELLTVPQISKITGINEDTLYGRLQKYNCIKLATQKIKYKHDVR